MDHEAIMAKILKDCTESAAELGIIENIEYIGNDSSKLTYKPLVNLTSQKILFNTENLINKYNDSFVTSFETTKDSKTYHLIFNGIYRVNVNFFNICLGKSATCFITIKLLSGNKEKNIKSIYLDAENVIFNAISTDAEKILSSYRRKDVDRINYNDGVYISVFNRFIRYMKKRYTI